MMSAAPQQPTDEAAAAAESAGDPIGENVILDETAAVLDFLAAQDGPHLSELPVAIMREVYQQLGDGFDSPRDPSIRSIDFVGAEFPLRAYFPGALKAGPVIIYMHGGGWLLGDLDTHDALCGLIASVSGLRVVAVDYNCAPEHRFPRAHEDCLAATAFIADSPAQLEAPVTGIAVAGDSAGGNLAFHVAAHLGGTKMLGQLLIYPLGDCTSRVDGSYKQFEDGYLLDRRLLDRFIGEYLPNAGEADDSRSSPLLHPFPPMLPPTVILAAGLDPLRDQARELAARIAAQGIETHYIEAAGLIHGMATMRRALPTADGMVRRAIAIFTDMIVARQAMREEIIV